MNKFWFDKSEFLVQDRSIEEKRDNIVRAEHSTSVRPSSMVSTHDSQYS